MAMFLQQIRTMAAVIPAVTRISPRIIRILGCNPGSMTLQGTNTYIVGTGRRRILIDTGDADIPEYINHLKTIIDSEGITLAHIFISHRHHDHIGGLADVFDKLKDQTKHCQVWKFPSLKDEPVQNIQLENLKDGLEFEIEGATLRVVHTPGHTDDHAVFHLLEDSAVFSGDCILGEGTAVFEDLHDYMNSLQDISNLQPEIIYPGHGNIITKAMEKISFYISHRMERENQIIDVLGNNKSKTFGEEDIVKLIYNELPEKLAKAAEYNVNHHLVKLLKEDKVMKTDSGWQIKHYNFIKSR